MNRIITALLCVFALSQFWSIGYAQEQSLSEAILSFDSQIVVNVDNSIDVTETITYATGPMERHGIFRDLRRISSQDRKMSIEDVAVTDLNGQPYEFRVMNSGDDMRIRIGDPDRTFSGEQTYVIKYHATRAIAQLETFDELYWNVTGNGWGMPIYQANASIELPPDVRLSQSACYYGPEGSTARCEAATGVQEEVATFRAPAALAPGEGLTVAVGFPKGVMTAYTAADEASGFIDRYGKWLIALLLPVLTLIFSIWYWYKNGRDARGTGVIYPEYEAPDELTPMEVGGIVNHKIDAGSISAEIIYLATKGYLKITQLEKKTLGIFNSTDYELTALRDFSDPNEFDRKLLEALFSVRSEATFADLKKALSFGASPAENPAPAALQSSVKLSDLKNVFYTDVPAIISVAANALLTKGYFKNLGRMKSVSAKVLTVIMSVAVAMIVAGIASAALTRGNILPIVFGAILSVIIFATIYHFSPAKSEKGARAKEHILGLKQYLQIAEKDRLLFHNAPEKKPEVFEKLLPYAMILGVAAIWAKEFEGIYTTPPSWYSGQGGTFSAIAFSHTMTEFSSYASTSLASSPGSGGGGSSGGGGGGGGGGGW